MINLGDKNWGVKDSGLLAYKQVGLRFFNKDFDFTRASNGTYVDKNGVLQTAELYNLLPYSNDFSQYTLGSGLTLTSNQNGYDATSNAWLYADTSTGNSLQTSISSSGIQTLSIYVKEGIANGIRLRWIGSSGGDAYFNISDSSTEAYNTTNTITTTKESVGSNWHRVSVTFNDTINTIRIYVADGSGTSSVNGNIYIQDAQLVEGTEPLDYQYTNGLVGIPRIDFSDGVGALLLEPQTTNLVTYSEDYSQSSVWVKTGNTSISLNSIISPDGTQNASRISGLDGSGANDLRYFPSGFNSANKTLTFSAYLKGSGTLRMQMSNGVNQGPSQTITLTSDWKRHSLTATFNSTTSAGFHINFDDLDGVTATSYDLYGVQLEEKSYATSLINTSGSAVTRIADVANNCGSEQDFNSEEGVLYAEIAALADDLTYRGMSISDGSKSNRVSIYYSNISNEILGLVISGFSIRLNIAHPLYEVKDYHKIAIKYKENDFALWANGVEVGTANTGATPIGLSELAFDGGDGTDNFYGKVRSVKYFPEALGDTKLMTLTGGDGSLQGLFNTFQARVLADGGTIEAETCIKNEIKELL